MDRVKCSECGALTAGLKFCTECGKPLSIKRTKDSVKEKTPEVITDPVSNKRPNSLGSDVNSEQRPNTSVSDVGLEMLIDTCKKTMATVGGDGYSEYVLYKRDEKTYELHYYSKYEYMKSEVHYAYKSNKAIVEEAFKRIEALKLESFQNSRGDSMAGGMRIVKFKKGDKMIRITTDQLPTAKQGYIVEIEGIITKTANEANRLN